MKAWMKNFKLLVAISTVLVVFASTSVAYGGLRWVGFDPEMTIGDHKVNVFIEWPAEYTCDIDDIHIRVMVPKGADVELMGESSGEFKCDGEMITLESETEIVERGRGNEVRIMGRIDSDKHFPMLLKVYVDDKLEQKCFGRHNSATCKPMRLLERVHDRVRARFND